MAIPARIALDSEDGVTVVRFFDRQILDERLAREVHDQIEAATPAGQPMALILDFSGVSLVSSAFIGRLVLLQRKADRTGGKLWLCDLAKTVGDVLRTTNLDRILHVARDRHEAREAIRGRS